MNLKNITFHKGLHFHKKHKNFLSLLLSSVYEIYFYSKFNSNVIFCGFVFAR